MKRFAVLALFATALSQAQAQGTSGWTIEERLLDDGARALVLSRPQGEARLEYRVRHLLRRSVAHSSQGCSGESSSTEMLTVAERLELGAGGGQRRTGQRRLRPQGRPGFHARVR